MKKIILIKSPIALYSFALAQNVKGMPARPSGGDISKKENKGSG